MKRYIYENTPRWVIFVIDLSIVFFSFILAYALRFNFNVPDKEIPFLLRALPVVLFVRGISFYISKIYKGLVRYTSTEDAKKIFFTLSTASLFFVFLNLFFYHFTTYHYYLLPFSILIIEYLTTTFLMLTLRIFVKILYEEYSNPNKYKSNVIIFGAGETGIIAKRAIDRDKKAGLKVIAFIDEDKRKINNKIEGVKIYPYRKLKELIVNNNVNSLIISLQNISAKKKNEITELCIENNVKVLTVPPVIKWINGELSYKQLKEIKIEDLLERTPIHLDLSKIRTKLEGKKILITGAAGSIGSELVRQILKFNPKKLMLIDQAETPLYNLEIELSETHKDKYCIFKIADITNKNIIEKCFESFLPNLVFHAAAYKHVPLMEENPVESIITNVYGTKIVADLSHKYGVANFVMISTDKAVKPTSIMGASKRASEIYVQSLNKLSNTSFITTRFGNVLGSNGSVIPLFKRQIERGGPITVTHPEVTRYFMTISEASELVLQASTIGKGGEIFIFDMGKSVKIYELAKKMIKLSGLEIGKDIQIIFTGLRPGEKLYEELLNNKENTLPTIHPKILIAKVIEYNFEKVKKQIDKLIELAFNNEEEKLISLMKELIPEYKSNNSEFAKVDT